MSVSIKDQWEEFQHEVIPEDAPNEQIRDMELAFYSGVYTLLGLSIIVAGAEEGADDLMELHAEAGQFFIDRDNEREENENDTGICMLCYHDKSDSNSCDMTNCPEK